ncbi:phage protein [Paenibacillus marchantiophytorum]|uniref:Phage protein n=1 Tax=Paenibacillus marchantiophytorum TaxID=1619310 RepID=A0ABQ2BPC5_9BACL|nr:MULTISPECIES: phage tail tube protein [Paenibacillus]UKS24318.1 phage tail tube protein [Paenibacillus sp. HWE-109]GGI44359.1 phage protein [Paenibacillus marchantiophytorum]
MGFLHAKDTISGQSAKAYATINGQVEEMFYAKKFEAKIKKNKKEIKTLGKLGTQNKANGFTGTGTMTIYYVTSAFRQLMLNYTKNGIDNYFDIQVVNDDPSSSVGIQDTVIRNVNLDEITIASFDVESESLEEEVSFTFDDWDMFTKFKQPTLN